MVADVRCSAANLAPGHHLNDVSSVRLVIPSMLDVPMFDVPPQISHVPTSQRLLTIRAVTTFIRCSPLPYSHRALSEISLRHQAPGQRMHLTAV